MRKYVILADPRVADDLKEARDFLNSKRKGYGKKFLAEYRQILHTFEEIPNFQIRYSDIRCLPFKTFKYMVHFKVDESLSTVHIFAVISTYLNPDKHWL